MLGELIKIFPRYEFEKLEKQHQSNHYTFITRTGNS